MADIYVSSVDGNDADNGSTWALAKATLAAAMTAAGAGGRVFVDPSHAESAATVKNLASAGTAASPQQILCVVRDANEPPTALSTGGSVTTTSGGSYDIDFAGFAYVYGMTFQAGDGINTCSLDFSGNANLYWVFDTCALKLGNTSGIAYIGDVGGSITVSAGIVLINSTVEVANTSQYIKVGSHFYWYGGSITGATLPTTLFGPCLRSANIVVRGVDLSALGSNNIFNLSAAQPFIRLENCKLGTSFSLSTGSIVSQEGCILDVINCDSGDTNYNYFKKRYQGEISDETTIVRSGGASDGTTAVSRKMVSSANSSYVAPLVLDGIVFWNETAGSSVTATVEVVTDNVTLTDKEAWIEVEYLGTSGFPVASFVNDKAGPLATAANQTSSSVTWSTAGLSTPIKQSLAVSFTPQEKGLVRVRVNLAKASTTMYVCPKVDIT